MKQSLNILWGLVILLLVINLGILYALNLARQSAIQQLEKAEQMVYRLSQEKIAYDIPLNRPIPLKASVPLNQQLEIPVNTVVPFDQLISVPIQTPAGEIMVDLPIQAEIPLNVVVPVNFNDSIEIDTVIDLDATVPVEIEIAKTGLVPYLQTIGSDLNRLKQRLAFGRASSSPFEVEQLQTAGENPEADQTASQVNDQPVADSEPSNAASSENTTSEACTHLYWPLNTGTTWSYNSRDTSFTQRVDQIGQGQVQISTLYEGKPLSFSFYCQNEGLGGSILGDMRRLSELGQLRFNNPRGSFLAAPAQITNQEPWTQAFDVNGTVEGWYQDQSIEGTVRQGQASVSYTPAGFETIETPFGSQEAMKLDQKIELSLAIDFALDQQVVAATENYALTETFWFVENVGLVQSQWLGGSLERSLQGGTTPSETIAIPSLALDQLVSACIMDKNKSFECKQLPDQAGITRPAESELEIPPFDIALSLGEAASSSTTGNPAAQPSDTENPSSGDQTDSTSANPADEDENSPLSEYGLALNRALQQISGAGNTFGKTALMFQAGQATLEDLERDFDRFKLEVRPAMNEINQLSPPPEVAVSHQKITVGLEKCDEAINLFNEWLNSFDSSTQQRAALLVTQCLNEVQDGGEEIEARIG